MLENAFSALAKQRDEEEKWKRRKRKREGEVQESEQVSPPIRKFLQKLGLKKTAQRQHQMKESRSVLLRARERWELSANVLRTFWGDDGHVLKFDCGGGWLILLTLT